VEVLICADPTLNVADPTDVCPSRNDIDPDGVPVPLAAATFAVSVTLLPAVICVADNDKAVLVLTFAGAETVTGTAAEVDGEKLESPEYVAVTLCEPLEREEVVNAAVPEVKGTVPSEFAPSRKLTVPVGLPLPDCGVTVAVNVTLCPLVSCVLDALSEVVVAARVPLAAVKTKTLTE